MLGAAPHGGVDAHAITASWGAEGAIHLVGTEAYARLTAEGYDPRALLDATAPIVDLRRDEDGRWRGEAGVGWLVSQQAEDAAWATEEGAVFRPLDGSHHDGCWTSGRRTVATTFEVRPRALPGGWWLLACGERFRVQVFPGRAQLEERWRRSVLAALVGPDHDGCRLRSSGCDPSRLVARCGDRWVSPAAGGAQWTPGPDVPRAQCGWAGLRDTGVEVPDPCATDTPLGCGPLPFPASVADEPLRARPYVRWCSDPPGPWTGPGLHPPYRAGRPHGSILACWRRALERDADACGELRAEVARPLAPGGPTQIGDVVQTVGDAELEACVRRALADWTPPGPADGGAVELRALLRAPSPAVPRSAEPAPR